MRSYGRYDWCPYKRTLGHRHTEGKPKENTKRRWHLDMAVQAKSVPYRSQATSKFPQFPRQTEVV